MHLVRLPVALLATRFLSSSAPVAECAALGQQIIALRYELSRQQPSDFKAGRTVGNHVPVRALSRMERGRLVDSFRAIGRIREKAAVEIGGQAV